MVFQSVLPRKPKPRNEHDMLLQSQAPLHSNKLVPHDPSYPVSVKKTRKYCWLISLIVTMLSAFTVLIVCVQTFHKTDIGVNYNTSCSHDSNNRKDNSELPGKDIDMPSPENSLDHTGRGLDKNSENSKLDIYNVTKEVSRNISTFISNLNSVVIDHVVAQERNISDLNELHSRIKETYDSFSSIKEIKNLKVFTQNIRTIINKLNITIPSEIFESVSQYDHALTFLNKCDRVYNGSSDWMDVYRSLLKNLDSSYKWYSFLNNVLTHYSKYDVQKDLYHHSKISGNLTQGLEKLSASDVILDILKVVLTEEEYGRNNEGVLSDIKMKHLESVIDSIFGNTMTIAYDNLDKVLRVEGDFIKLSDVKKYQAAVENLKSIQIFSSRKILIDSDLDATDVSQVSIIAPIWEIVGENRIISLNGTIGEGYPTADTPEKVGAKGYDGKAGRPGNSAGHFLGIGETFVDSHHLQIHSVGGQGGPGQRGGAGTNGAHPLYLHFNIDGELKWPEGYGYKCEPLKEIRLDFVERMKYETNCTVETLCDGVDGGDGGIGGFGGDSGQIITISLENNPEIIKVQTPGENGEPGEGGVAGLAASEGGKCIFRCGTPYKYFNQSHDPVPEGWDCFWFEESVESKICSSGKEGHTGESKQGLPLQDPAEIPLPNIPKIVNWYKDFARKKTGAGIQDSLLKKFISEVERHPQVKDSQKNM